MRRLRWWLVAVLAGCAVLGVVLLGRRSEQGILVVEAGPDVEVIVAGHGAVWREKGSCRLSVPAGRYEVWCLWKGRAGRSLWAQVRAGGEEEVRPASPAPVRPAPRPFVVVSRDEPERVLDRFEEAVEAARPGETIEVHGNGPFVSRPVRLDGALVVRAAEGFRPVIRLIPDAERPLIDTTASLVLEGLELDARPVKGGATYNRLALAARGPALHLAFCRTEQTGENTGILVQSPLCNVLHCACLAQRWPALSWIVSRGGRLRLQQSVLGNVVLDLATGPLPGVTVEVRRCAFRRCWAAIEARYDRAPLGRAPVNISVYSSVFAPTAWVLLANRTRDVAVGADVVGKLLRWEESGNVYARGPALLGHAINHRPVGEAVRTLEAWQQVWGTAKIDAQIGPERIADGADEGQVGPGRAYQRWRKTAEYRRWREATGQGAEE
jgi:hypothetical protein